MYKSIPSGLKNISLDNAVHKLHKRGEEKSEFGMDNSSELLEGGFGLYSSADLVTDIGPIKTQYFRIALTRSGQAFFDVGLEKYKTERNVILFGFPGQIFSLHDASPEFFVYYMLFSEEFIPSVYLLQNKRESFPFLTATGIHSFPLTEETARMVETIIGQMNEEIKSRQAGCAEMVRLYIQQILLLANRNYDRNILAAKDKTSPGQTLYTNYVKLVSRHFIDLRKVSDYAEKLHVSADHLNRVVRSVCGKTAGELIDDMIILETKAYLIHSTLSISEISYKLEFSDPSHFNKFFKKLCGLTPLQFRENRNSTI